MKIVFSNYDDVNNPYYGGGGAYAIHEVAKRLAKRHKVTVVTGNYPNAKTQFIDSVEYRRIGLSFLEPKLSQLIFHLLLPYYFRKSSFDVWIESFTPPFSTSFLPFFGRGRVIGLAHMLAGEDMKRKYKLPFDLIEKFGLKLYREFIVLNKKTEEKIRGIDRTAKIAIIPNGINVPKIAKTRSKHILFIGRIEINQKGLDLLLKAYEKLGESFDIPLLIAGSGTKSEENKLQRMIRDLGIQKKIKLVGRIEGREKERAFREAYCVVIPSRYETFSLVSLEAASYRLPIVSFDIEGLGWLKEGCAIKIPHFNVDKFSKTLFVLTSDFRLREKVGKKARNLARTFSWDDIAEKYEEYLMG
ncbi:MAG: hypothetical protein UT24_C0008G0028 [Candidatus Woesebacteria bacterium GW2011_GWB1_39_12]|uniref:Glycosyltransferase subfamily 4-like N-terminal domain-containing protein n=2 Tax=Candidatus Woeseibacteriota TaxID=1752722 RepID=A0A0G0M2E5_9BACT|nr:MAG: hypothetical protein UT23_C0012G0072 [Candidatus Woesebacteria bacterium GW2011_GWA1_39_12]KKR00900.1 MAG: hypothetical protein UT24_C0008G0028 [Candidatus Woesebacteria bacterium GW2011_GWB1_39_12]